MKLKMIGLLALLSVTGSVFAFDLGVNRTFYIHDGEQHSGSLNTINGSIKIGQACSVRGTCRTINGKIVVGDKSRVRGLETINGNIDIDHNVRIMYDVKSINGGIDAREGSIINGDINTINGKIDLRGAVVDGDVTTYNGDMNLNGKSRIDGDIIIKPNKDHSNRHKPLTIVLKDQAVIMGDIIVKDEDRRVEVIIQGRAKVKGDIINATLVK